LLSRFDDSFGVETSELTPAGDLLAQVGEARGLARMLGRLGVEEESPGVAAAALEFALEGLHLSRRLNKDQSSRVGAYRYERRDPSTR
jgi:magnesium chelatase subunit I